MEIGQVALSFKYFIKYIYCKKFPASGEIDICETRGNRNLTSNGGNIGVQQTGSTLHVNF